MFIMKSVIAILLILAVVAAVIVVRRQYSNDEWKCGVCGRAHSGLPTAIGGEAPWRDYVPEAEFEKRVQLTADTCVIDSKDFMVRGHIELPIHGHQEHLAISVWTSLSEKSYNHMIEHWTDPNREKSPPYFGWLLVRLGGYPDTMHLKLQVHSRAPGVVPWIELEPTGHPLAVEQEFGISVERWRELVGQLTGGGS
jgi:hypothetical protein